MQIKLKLTVAAAIAAACGIASAQDMVVKIGHVGPDVRRRRPTYGKDNENGVRMAIEDLNAKGVTIGGKKVKFEIQAEDDAADPKQGTAAAQKLCDAKVNGVVGHLNSGTTIPASKVYNDCGIPQVTAVGHQPQADQARLQDHLPHHRQRQRAGRRPGAATRPTTSSSRRSPSSTTAPPTARASPKCSRRRRKSKGMQVVGRAVHHRQGHRLHGHPDRDQGQEPRRRSSTAAWTPQAGPMLRQMEQLGMTNVKFFGGDGICTQEIIKLAAGAKTLGNVVCAEGGASLAKMPGGKAWKKRYDAKYPGQFQVYSPYTYDATFVLVDAMKRANSADPKVYTAKLAARRTTRA